MTRLSLDASAWMRALKPYAYPVALFVVARVCLSVWAILIVSLFAPPTLGDVKQTIVFAYDTPSFHQGELFLSPWYRWDTHWYLKIAADGYAGDDGSIAYFPLYSMLIRIVGTLFGGDLLFAALLIANLAALASFVLMYRMVARQFGEDVARRALLFLIVFPMAFFFFAGYTESLFLLLALLALHFAQEGRWWQSGLVGGLAALTRAPGIALVVPLAIEFIGQYRQGRARVRDLVLLLAMCAIGAAYWLYLWYAFGDFGIWSRSMAQWRANGMPGESIVLAIRSVTGGLDFAWGNNVIDLTATLFFLVLIVWGFFRLPRTLAVYSAALILPPLLSVQKMVWSLPLASLPRYGIVLFPVFITLAMYAHPRLQIVGVAVSLVLQFLFVAFFVQWVWIA